MWIKYLGGRTLYSVDYERKGYNFTLENNRTLEIKDQKVINYIFSLPNRAEFEAVEPEEPKSVSFDGIGDTVELKPKEKIVKKGVTYAKRKKSK